jgi:hypothetical protein
MLWNDSVTGSFLLDQQRESAGPSEKMAIVGRKSSFAPKHPQLGHLRFVDLSCRMIYRFEVSAASIDTVRFCTLHVEICCGYWP